MPIFRFHWVSTACYHVGSPTIMEILVNTGRLKSCIGELVFQILFSLPFYFSLSNFPHHLISFLCTSHCSHFLSLLLDYYMSLSFHSPSCLITFFLYSSLQQPYKFIVADVAMRENGFCVHLQTLQIPAALVLNDFTGRRVAASPIILHFSEDLVQFVIIFLTLHFFFILLLNYFVFFFLFTFYFSLCNITL